MMRIFITKYINAVKKYRDSWLYLLESTTTFYLYIQNKSKKIIKVQLVFVYCSFILPFFISTPLQVDFIIRHPFLYFLRPIINKIKNSQFKWVNIGMQTAVECVNFILLTPKKQQNYLGNRNFLVMIWYTWQYLTSLLIFYGIFTKLKYLFFDNI